MDHAIYHKWDSDKREAYTVCKCGWDCRVDAPFDNITTAGFRHMEEVRKAVRGKITVKFGRKHYTATCSAHGVLYVGTLAQIVEYQGQHHSNCTFVGGDTEKFLLALMTEGNQAVADGV